MWYLEASQNEINNTDDAFPKNETTSHDYDRGFVSFSIGKPPPVDDTANSTSERERGLVKHTYTYGQYLS